MREPAYHPRFEFCRALGAFCAAATLLLAFPAAADDLVVTSESPSFTLDTRLPGAVVVPADSGVVTSESPVFVLDTRLPPPAVVVSADSGVVMAETPVFTLDTVDPAIGVLAHQFGFTVTGTINQVVVVEVCTNLVDPAWYPLQTNTLTTGAFYFTDAQWTYYSVRFYRLRPPQAEPLRLNW